MTPAFPEDRRLFRRRVKAVEVQIELRDEHLFVAPFGLKTEEDEGKDED